MSCSTASRRLAQLAGDKLIVSTASEDEWLDNIVKLGWRLYLCSSPPYLFQTKADRRMRDYTDLAFRGEVARAKAVRDSLKAVREAFKRTRRRRNSIRIRNTGRTCSARSVARCARRCSN